VTRPAALLAAALTLALAQPVAAFDPASMTDAQRAAFRAEIRAYLLENPEVLLEAIEALESRQAALEAQDDAALVAAFAAELFHSSDDWVGGNPDGDVTLVEFIDYNCGFCRRAHPEVLQVLARDTGVRFVVKELPILGPGSEAAGRMAVAVLQLYGDAAYERLNDRFLTARGELNAESAARIVADLGHDIAAVRARAGAPEVTRVLEANRDLATRLRLSGTPSFALPDRLVRGMLPADALLSLIAEAREAG